MKKLLIPFCFVCLLACVLAVSLAGRIQPLLNWTAFAGLYALTLFIRGLINPAYALPYRLLTSNAPSSQLIYHRTLGNAYLLSPTLPCLLYLFTTFYYIHNPDQIGQGIAYVVCGFVFCCLLHTYHLAHEIIEIKTESLLKLFRTNFISRYFYFSSLVFLTLFLFFYVIYFAYSDEKDIFKLNPFAILKETDLNGIFDFISIPFEAQVVGLSAILVLLQSIILRVSKQRIKVIDYLVLFFGQVLLVSSLMVVVSFFKMATSLASLSAIAKMIPPLCSHLCNLVFTAMVSVLVFSKRKTLILEKIKQPAWHYPQWLARLVMAVSLGVVLTTLFVVESSWITIGFTLLFFAFCVYLVLSRQKLEKTIKERTAELSDEKDKVESLLLNILPAYVLEELREKGKSDPRSFEDVAILFTDFVGFTKISSQLAPLKLIEELNDMFTHFDEITERHHCERIKTIGDSYMAVAGLSGTEKNPTQQMAHCAIEILKFIEQRNKTSVIEWKIRIGISAGQSMGGIVGKTKYLFDLFGDTINIASRMESNSEPMKINVSEAAFKKLDGLFTFVERSEIDVKGKGKMKMYFLEETP